MLSGEGSGRQFGDIEDEVGESRRIPRFHAKAIMMGLLLFSTTLPAVYASERPTVLHQLLVQPRDVDLHVDASAVSIDGTHPRDTPSSRHAASAGETRGRLGEALRGAHRGGVRRSGARPAVLALVFLL